MGLVNRRVRDRVGGLRIVIRPITVDLGPIYKRYGVSITVRAIRRRRRRRGVRIHVVNYYFGIEPIRPGVVTFIRSEDKITTNARKTILADFSFNDGDGTSLPYTGFVSRIFVNINGVDEDYTIKKGSIDPSYRII